MHGIIKSYMNTVLEYKQDQQIFMCDHELLVDAVSHSTLQMMFKQQLDMTSKKNNPTFWKGNPKPFKCLPLPTVFVKLGHHLLQKAGRWQDPQNCSWECHTFPYFLSLRKKLFLVFVFIKRHYLCEQVMVFWLYFKFLCHMFIYLSISQFYLQVQ